MDEQPAIREDLGEVIEGEVTDKILESLNKILENPAKSSDKFFEKSDKDLSLGQIVQSLRKISSDVEWTKIYNEYKEILTHNQEDSFLQELASFTQKIQRFALIRKKQRMVEIGSDKDRADERNRIRTDRELAYSKLKNGGNHTES